MAASKGILRSVIVLALILTAGFLGLWFLGGPEIKVKNQNISSGGITATEEKPDQFYDFGGKTPRETLKLLISALEKSDLALAAKYFTQENRETVSDDLARLSNTNLLGNLIKDLKNIKIGKSAGENNYYFEVLDEADQSVTRLELAKNQKGFWKVISL